MRIMYPSNYTYRGPLSVDEYFGDEYELVGDDAILLANRYGIVGDVTGHDCLYRGWMLTQEEYAKLEESVTEAGGHMLVSTDEYKSNHWISGWINEIAYLTPETVLTTRENAAEVFYSLGWDWAFVKDYVKSNTGRKGSIAWNVEHVEEILAEIELFRGQIEGGVALRKVEQFDKGTEKRYFVVNGYAPVGSPDIVAQVAKLHRSRFFSVDIAVLDYRWRVVEIGDGQVSDPKGMDLSSFVNMLYGVSSNA